MQLCRYNFWYDIILNPSVLEHKCWSFLFTIQANENGWCFSYLSSSFENENIFNVRSPSSNPGSNFFRELDCLLHSHVANHWETKLCHFNNRAECISLPCFHQLFLLLGHLTIYPRVFSWVKENFIPVLLAFVKKVTLQISFGNPSANPQSSCAVPIFKVLSIWMA